MSTTAVWDPVGSTLFSKTRAAVLGLLYGHADEAFYLREIAERTGLGVGQIQREVAQLSRAGILRREARGRHIYFQSDRDCPVFDELRKIVVKTSGGAAALRDLLAPLRGKIDAAFVYGSVARGEEHRASDLDLMVVGDVTFGELAGAVRKAEARLLRSINPTVYPAREFRAKLAAGHPFLKRVVDGEKLFVLGDEHELGSLSAQRVDPPARDNRRRHRQPARRRGS